MSDRIFSGSCATSGLPLTANGPVRFYITGALNQRALAPCTGAQDALCQGIAKRGVATAGVAAGYLGGHGDEFLGLVSTTVVAGQGLQINNRQSFKPTSPTAGNRYVARALQGRTNTGRIWMQYVPNGVL